MRSLNGKRSLIIVLILLVIFLLIAAYQITSGITDNKPTGHVSMIVYGDDSERWENMREGAYLVCKADHAF